MKRIIILMVLCVMLVGCNSDKKVKTETNKSYNSVEKTNQTEEDTKQNNEESENSSEEEIDVNNSTDFSTVIDVQEKPNADVNVQTSTPEQNVESNPSTPETVEPEPERDPMELFLINDWCLNTGNANSDFTRFNLNSDYTGTYDSVSASAQSFTWSYDKINNQLIFCLETYQGTCNRGVTLINATKKFDYLVQFGNQSPVYELCNYDYSSIY